MSYHPSQNAEEYQRYIEHWRTYRVEKLTSADSWLSLAGLFWLTEGDHSIGSDPSSAVTLPEKHTPLHVGTVHVSKTGMAFTAASGVQVFENNSPVTHTAMAFDTQPSPTVLKIGSVSFMALQRGLKTGIRVRDSESPRRKEFKGLQYYPTDPAWNIQGTLTRYNPPRKATVPTAVGGNREEEIYGQVAFTVQGKKYTLEVMQDGEQYFIAFADSTNGKETYNPGRFLSATPDKDGVSVWLDFNKAYNPPCAFTPYATCSFPPKENKLPIPVTAGEKKYHG